MEEALPFVFGEVVGGKYRIERVIGRGGMAIVVEATHTLLDQRVALKFLRPEMMTLPDVVSRFDREARAVVKLKSDHVARVIDVGKTDAGIPYMVMEYLEGKDLGDTLAQSGPLPVAQAVEYIIQACEGVGEAHARGIVHRDIKPENLFLVTTSDGWRSVKVLDFGISKAVLVGPSSVDMSSHETRSIMGSPYYMSPEQLRSTKSVDHRADVWSLGVVLFELLTGTMPFDETREFTELVAAVLESPHRRLSEFRLDVPDGLEAVVDRCLQKDRSARFQNTAELAVALLPFAPKRARVMVERATSMSKAAGLSDPTFQMPPSDIPPPSAHAYLPIGMIGAPRVPKNLTPISSPSIGGSVETLAPAANRRVPRVMLIALGALLVAAGCIVALVLVLAHKPSESVVAAPERAPTLPTPVLVAGGGTTARPHGHRRILVVEPRDAKVTLDGKRVPPGTPFIEGSESALLEVEAPGRRSSDQTVMFDTDDPIVVQLDPLTPLPTQRTQPRTPITSVSATPSQTTTAPPPPPPSATVNPTDVGY